MEDVVLVDEKENEPDKKKPLKRKLTSPEMPKAVKKSKQGVTITNFFSPKK